MVSSTKDGLEEVCEADNGFQAYVHSLIPIICKCLISKSRFCKLSKLKIFIRGNYPGLSGQGFNAITSVIIREGQRETERYRKGEGNMLKEAEIGVMSP